MSRSDIFNSLQTSLKSATDDLLSSLSDVCKKNKMEVLYIDDDFRNLRSFKRASREVFNLHTCGGISEARGIIEANNIELILCDYKLPELNGLETCDELDGVLKKIPVIMVTGYESEVQEDPLYKKLNFEIINKPFSMLDIINSDMYQYANTFSNRYGKNK